MPARAGVPSRWPNTRTGVHVAASPGWTEARLVAGFASLAVTLALLPALTAGRRPVLDDLRA